MGWGNLPSSFKGNNKKKIDSEIEAEIEEKPESLNKKRSRTSSYHYQHSTKYLYRRAFSEIELLNKIDKLEDGYTYNFITGGDIDALSYLSLVIRLQKKLDYCLFSTWCMSGEDILQFDEWLSNGAIKKLDAYVGEIFPSSYFNEYRQLKDMFEKHNCGRIAVFRNHSKIFAGCNGDFYFGIQTSANINTNPRSEQGSITIDKGIFEFYKEYFDGIISFAKDEKEN